MTTEQITEDTSSPTPPDRPQSNGWRTFGIIVITIVLTFGVGYFAVTIWLFPTEFRPVELSQKQQRTLDQKIAVLSGDPQNNEKGTLEPEAYTEVGASREVEFSERELNALLAKNTDLANKLALDLSDNLVSAKLLVNVDPDFPIMGGKTVKLTGGMELQLVNNKPARGA